MNKREVTLIHEFVEFIPADIQEGKLYISIPYATVAHKCACGCGKEVITPLSPTDWKLIFDGQSVSLDPSIGNWSFDCKSHYWIKHNRVVWAEVWSKDRIERGRVYDRVAKGHHYTQEAKQSVSTKTQKSLDEKTSQGFWSKVRTLWSLKD